MVPQLIVSPLGNRATARRCTCGCLASHVVVAIRHGQADRAMSVCDDDARLLTLGAPRLRQVG